MWLHFIYLFTYKRKCNNISVISNLTTIKYLLTTISGNLKYFFKPKWDIPFQIKASPFEANVADKTLKCYSKSFILCIKNRRDSFQLLVDTNFKNQ